MQQNRKCRIRRDWDEKVNHYQANAVDLLQKEYKTKHDREGKSSQWELCNILRLVRVIKWYKYKLDFVQENSTHDIIRNMEIQTDHQILSWRADLAKKKTTCRLLDFVVPVEHRNKKNEGLKKNCRIRNLKKKRDH